MLRMGVAQQPGNLRVAAFALHAPHKACQCLAVGKPAAGLEFGETSVIAQLYSQRSHRGRCPKHFLLLVSGGIPRRLAACSGINSKEDAWLFLHELRNRLTFLQERSNV